MKVCWQGYLHGNHSWGIVAQNLSRALIKIGHEVDLFATNGINNFPDDLKQNLIGYIDENTKQAYGRLPENDYDLQLSYTAPPNWKNYLSHGNRNRFGIWCYEWPVLPVGFAKNHYYTDYILAPSKFAKDGFINSGVPENKVKIIPHGVNIEQFNNKNKYKLKTKKKVILFCNIGQAHRRKNIRGMFEAYLKAFNKNDNVCLVAKISKNNLSAPFEVDPIQVYNDVKSKYKNAAEIELITEFVPDITELYNVCDIVYSLTFCEGFYMPGIEALFANKINICSNYGGQLDFLNDTNSLLVAGKMVRAPMEEQYWSSAAGNKHFEPDIDDAVEKLRYAFNNLDKIKNNYMPLYKNIKNNYTWDVVANSVLGLAK